MWHHIHSQASMPAAQHGSQHTIRTPRARCALNQTSNQTFQGSLVSWPRQPHFEHFPFHFPFRGEKGSAPRGCFGVHPTPAAWPSKRRVAAPCSYLGPAGGPTALPTGSATRFITYSRRFRIEGVVHVVVVGGGGSTLAAPSPRTHPPFKSFIREWGEVPAIHYL